MRFRLKALTEKAWKDTGKASQINKSEAPRSAWIRNDAGRYKFYSPGISYQSLGSRSFFSRAPTCAERCAQSVPKPRNFSRPHFEDLVSTRTFCKTGNRACSAFSVGITWVGISVRTARSGFCVKRRKTTEDFAQCEP